ncbi:MAG TPA: GGDEF domain-containing protein [Candidatus Hydrogenedentes bacterium]|nr:GGDEF domain-containing protein [Candidatus Hydrogenedentota bacterium]HOL75439.1 GGDEF domain-containing protein [Candidatus Hydrogenedentota bacterium]HPO84948.1 GGDEF domain-containing protein [Candidatus Hydrogenedentota bacterium]
MSNSHEEIKQEDTTRLISEEEMERLRRASPERRRASLIVVTGGEIGREYEVVGDEVVIGRCDTADIRINSRLVSRRHAAIRRITEKNMERYVVVDLESMNGTLLNNNPVKSAELQEGDKIQIGEVVFKFGYQDAFDAQFHKEIHRLIHYDRLTGLMTMESFRRVLEDTIHCAQPGEVFTLAMTDLDGLKRVNDTYGHLAGRMVVEAMGQMIRDTLRSTDIPALYGGDETVILYAKTGLEEACEVAERLRHVIKSRTFQYNEHTFGVTISQGLAQWPTHGATPERIIAAADAALYRAKAAGRNCVKTAAD